MALVKGEVALAKAKHAEAGEILERIAAGTNRAADKQFYRFLAATEYYKGGHYQRALTLAKKIQPASLAADVRSLFSKFMEDAKKRSSPNYEEQMRVILNKLQLAGKQKEMLVLFQNHPYLFAIERAQLIASMPVL